MSMIPHFFFSFYRYKQSILKKLLNSHLLTFSTKKYKSIIKEEKKKHDQIAFLVKTNLDCIKGFFSRSLIDSQIMLDGFLLTDEKT